jgi:hypothetical protein
MVVGPSKAPFDAALANVVSQGETALTEFGGGWRRVTKNNRNRAWNGVPRGNMKMQPRILRPPRRTQDDNLRGLGEAIFRASPFDSPAETRELPLRIRDFS